MANEIIVNDTVIKVVSYQEDKVNGLHKISVNFQVTSKDYHAITILLYEGIFDVKVPERDIAFRGTIHQYSTSITNLYEEGQVGDFQLSLIETKDEERE